MEPWFTKEAEIIKFPEPKQKVIRMPNVASYPDFLTGVKDLQNRLSDGQIKQPLVSCLGLKINLQRVK
jgi:hypothetical protein